MAVSHVQLGINDDPRLSSSLLTRGAAQGPLASPTDASSQIGPLASRRVPAALLATVAASAVPIVLAVAVAVAGLVAQ